MAPPPAAAVDPAVPISHYAFRRWLEPSGLPQSYVKTILQTRDGYLWVGTKGGLGRFDGLHFDSFDSRVPGQLQDDEVWALLEDSAGVLWIGTYGGGLTRYRDGIFDTLTRQDGLPSDFVTSLAQCPSGELWIGTLGGLGRLEGKLPAVYSTEGPLAGRVSSVHCDVSGTLWAGTESGLARLDSGRLTYHPLERHVTSIVPDGAGGLWLATPAGLLRFCEGGVRTYSIHDGLTDEAIGRLWRDSNGSL
jgi:ligand-binding sensor domain-containing protein